MACVICGENEVAKAWVYPKISSPFTIPLCHPHDRELFLCGQEKFLHKHLEALKNAPGPEAKALWNNFKQILSKTG